MKSVYKSVWQNVTDEQLITLTKQVGLNIRSKCETNAMNTVWRNLINGWLIVWSQIENIVGP